MIEGASLDKRADPILKLVSLQKRAIEEVLIQRGIDPANVDASLEAVAVVGLSVDLNEAIEYPFRAQLEPPPYRVGRFGDGSHPVFYSALDVATCIEEVRHHRRQELAELQSGELPFPRYFTVVACKFDGGALMLRGHEEAHPDLISQTSAGYPFCQAVAKWAQGRGAQALHTTSARRQEGTCVPVFVRECLSEPQRGDRYRFVVKNGRIEYERLPS